MGNNKEDDNEISAANLKAPASQQMGAQNYVCPKTEFDIPINISVQKAILEEDTSDRALT